MILWKTMFFALTTVIIMSLIFVDTKIHNNDDIKKNINSNEDFIQNFLIEKNEENINDLILEEYNIKSNEENANELILEEYNIINDNDFILEDYNIIDNELFNETKLGDYYIGDIK
jgi:hypothetical protein